MKKVKSSNRWQKLLMVLVNGGAVTKDQLEVSMPYNNMYRISAVIWSAKKRGAVIKSYKNGKGTESYELMNINEMKTFLSTSGLSSLPVLNKNIQPDIVIKVGDKIVETLTNQKMEENTTKILSEV